MNLPLVKNHLWLGAEDSSDKRICELFFNLKGRIYYFFIIDTVLLVLIYIYKNHVRCILLICYNIKLVFVKIFYAATDERHCNALLPYKVHKNQQIKDVKNLYYSGCPVKKNALRSNLKKFYEYKTVKLYFIFLKL